MQNKKTIIQSCKEKAKLIAQHKKRLFMTIMSVIAVVIMTTQTVAAVTVWEKAKEIMQDVYSQILLISTIAAVVTTAVALLMTNFSKNDRTVQESRAWLKRIIITWAILNGLGFIMSYVTPFFADGQWTDVP